MAVQVHRITDQEISTTNLHWDRDIFLIYCFFLLVSHFSYQELVLKQFLCAPLCDGREEACAAWGEAGSYKNVLKILFNVAAIFNLTDHIRLGKCQSDAFYAPAIFDLSYYSRLEK